jgi:outer membrane protein OmpA-like peptidoglycan-associated protein
MEKMKTKINSIKEAHYMQFLYSMPIKHLILGALFLTCVYLPIQAQEQSPKNEQFTEYQRPSWWFGVAAGANLNFYRGSTHELSADFTPPATFHKGQGVGLYLAPLIEFHNPDSRWGIILQAGYDNRKGTFDEVSTPCNCPADLTANLSYLTVEPSLRFAPFKSEFYVYAGPRFAYNIGRSYTYKQGINTAFPEQVADPDAKGDFSHVNDMLISMQIGVGYDFYLSDNDSKMQTVLTPFASFQPYFGQDPRSIETWNITTVRVGATLKFGRGSVKSSQYTEREEKTEPVAQQAKPDTAKQKPVVVAASTAIFEKDVRFYVLSPENIPTERRVRETFPIRNYIFFDLGSTEIPDRYVLLKKDQVKDFKEDRLEVFTPKRLSGRSDREMVVYYNVLNIVGDRMNRLPNATIKLVGSSEKGPIDGQKMAESVKKYLVDVFGVKATRITVEGRTKPKLPSEQPGGTKELTLLREGDRRVSIESTTPAMLMEYQTGPNTPLKPVEIEAVQVAPIDSYVIFHVEGATEVLDSWSLEIKSELGQIQKYGPYTTDQVGLPGKTILGTNKKGMFKVTMTGKTKNGKTVVKEATVNMTLWTPTKDEQGLRFSVIYEFNQTEAILIYEKYLTEVVTPKIPKGATVVLHGYTDNIGNPANNIRLSLERAKDVKGILDASLSKAGRTDVKFEVRGFGEDNKLSPFDNNFPEERFYNRTVIIDIIPKKVSQ